LTSTTLTGRKRINVSLKQDSASTVFADISDERGVWSAVSPSAQAYGRAVEAWGQWLHHWRRTRDGRALRTALACEWIAKERFAVWQAELKVNHSVWGAHAERAAREQLAVHKVMRQIRRDQRRLYMEVIAAVQLSSIAPDAGMVPPENPTWRFS
jgi:hypothetical protein